MFTRVRVGLAAFIVAVCALNVVWIREDTAPPRMFDDLGYLTESVEHYYRLQERGVLSFLSATTFPSRGGHPPMTKVLPVFMYLLVGPNTDAAMYAYTALIAVFCVYLFLLARELLQSDAKALLAVAITCMFPLTYGMWRNVMAEFGLTVAVVGCLYHVAKSDNFRHSGHAMASGLLVGWGLLWKVTFPIFVAGPIVLVLLRSGRRVPFRGLMLALVTMLVVAGPFYARSWHPVVAFAQFAASTENQRLWGLGPVLSPETIARYWLLVINWGISPYFFALLLVSLVMLPFRKQVDPAIRDTRFLLAYFLPAFCVLTFNPLKEVRHLLPVLPAAGIALAGLLPVLTSGLRRSVQMGLLSALMIWPLYQFASWSFDSPAMPRVALRWGPLMLSTKDLEAESLEWMPTYTFPANATQWPTRPALQLITHRLAGNESARVHVTGKNPYFNGWTLAYEASLARAPLMFDSPFSSDYAGSDFLVAVLAKRRYGPVDERPTAAEQALKAGAAPFTLVSTLPLPDGGELRLYEADGRPRSIR